MGVFGAVQDAPPPTPELDIVPGPAPGKTHGPIPLRGDEEDCFQGVVRGQQHSHAASVADDRCADLE